MSNQDDMPKLLKMGIKTLYILLVLGIPFGYYEITVFYKKDYNALTLAGSFIRVAVLYLLIHGVSNRKLWARRVYLIFIPILIFSRCSMNYNFYISGNFNLVFILLNSIFDFFYAVFFFILLSKETKKWFGNANQN